MSDTQPSEPVENHISHADETSNANCWMQKVFMILALLMLISVITSRLFHFPNSDPIGEANMIVFAC